MGVKSTFDDPLSSLLDRPIAFQPAFKVITGSTVAALFLSQAWYWSLRTKDDKGWFYKTQKEWESETRLSRNEQETARRHLRELGILQEALRTVPARLYYRVDKERVMNLLGVQYATFQHTGLLESSKQGCGVVANINKNSEITTETTTHPQPKSKNEDENIKNLPEGFQIELTNLGVYRKLWDEVAKALVNGYSLADLLALRIWTKDPRKFMSRLRDKSKAPKKYYDFSERQLAGKWVPEGV